MRIDNGAHNSGTESKMGRVPVPLPSTPSLTIAPDDIIDEIRRPVTAFLVRVLGHKDAVDDAVSETVLRVLERRRAGFIADRWTSYALRVAWTVALEQRGRRRKRVDSLERPEAVADDTPEEKRDLADWLASGLARLREEDRALLHLRYDLDLSYDDIAKITSWPIGSVKRRLHEARGALRQELERSGGGRADPLLFAVWPLFGRDLATGVGPAEISSGTGILPPATGLGKNFALKFLAILLIPATMIFGGLFWPSDDAVELSADRGATIANDEVARAPVPTNPTVPALPPAATERPIEAPALRGKTVDTGGRPVAGAALVLEARPTLTGDARTLASTISAADGSFALTLVSGKSADLRLAASARGYAPFVEPVSDVDSNEPRSIVLSPGLRLFGRVFGPDGGSIPGARLALAAQFSGARFLRETITDAEGAYRFEDLPNDPRVVHLDSAVIEARAEGFATTRIVAALAVPDGAGSKRLDVALATGGTVFGTVRDARTGAPVGGVDVAFIYHPEVATSFDTQPQISRDPVGRTTVDRTVTDASGRYFLKDLPVRSCGIDPWSIFSEVTPTFLDRLLPGGIVVHAKGYAPQFVEVPIRAPWEENRTLDVILAPPGMIRGRLLDEEGRPIPKIRVTALAAALQQRRKDAFLWRVSPQDDVSDVSRDDGRFEIDGLALEADGETTFELMTEGDRPIIWKTVDIAASAPDVDVGNLLLPSSWRHFTATIEVTDDRGRPIAGAHAVGCDLGQITLDGVTGADGRIVLDCHAPVELLEEAFVRIEANGFASVIEPMPENTEFRRIRLARERPVFGKIISRSGRPIGGAYLELASGIKNEAARETRWLAARDSAILATTISAEDGSFAFHGAPAGELEILVRIRNGLAFGAVALHGFPKGVLPGRVRDDEPMPMGLRVPIDVEVPRAAVEIELVDAASGKPIWSAPRASLMTVGGAFAADGMTIGPGRLLCRDVPAGDYRLSVDADGYLEKVVPGVRADTNVPKYRIALERGGLLKGRIVGPAEFSARRIVAKASRGNSHVPIRNLEVAADGEFRIDGIEPGKWRITAYAEGDEVEHFAIAPVHEMDVVAGEPLADVEIKLVGTLVETKIRLTGIFAGSPGAAGGSIAGTVGEMKLVRISMDARDAAQKLWSSDTMMSHIERRDGDDAVMSFFSPKGTLTVTVYDGVGGTRISTVEGGSVLVLDGY